MPSKLGLPKAALDLNYLSRASDKSISETSNTLPGKRPSRRHVVSWHVCFGTLLLFSLVNGLAHIRAQPHIPRGTPEPPPIGDEMNSVLTSLGYTLREEYRWHHIEPTRLNVTFMTLFSGYARVCHDEEYMRWVLNPCVNGLTSMTFLLQDSVPANMTVEFASYLDMCTSQIFNLTRGSRCNVVVGQQIYKIEKTKGCRWQTSMHLQYISLARSLDWATSTFPPHAYYVRARLDAPWCLPDNVGPEPFIAMNQYWVLRTANLTSLFPSDRFALMPRRALPYYFDAWKVWAPLDCTAGALFMSNGNMSANQFEWVSGEAVLSAHMNKRYSEFKWMRVLRGRDLVGDPVVRHVNKSHVKFQWNATVMTYSSMLSMTSKPTGCKLIDGGVRLLRSNATWVRDYR
jgi:hypothetical protein